MILPFSQDCAPSASLIIHDHCGKKAHIKHMLGYSNHFAAYMLYILSMYVWQVEEDLLASLITSPGIWHWLVFQSQV